MNRFYSTPLFGVCAVGAIAVTMVAPARADVFGRLHVTVKNADTEKPVENVKVTLHDTTNVRADAPLNSDATGGALSEPLENHAFVVTIEAAGFQTDTRTVNVAADTTTEVEVLLEPVEKTIQITGARSLLRPRTPTVQTQRTQNFIERSAALNNNPQQLQGLLATVPGIALDSNNQAHARGEHTQTSIYIGGFSVGRRARRAVWAANCARSLAKRRSANWRFFARIRQRNGGDSQHHGALGHHQAHF